MMPPPTVLATLVEISAPITFMIAASPSASRGVSALVETEVAIALAESWNPLVKSKPSATSTMTTTSAVEPTASGLLHRDGLDGVRHVLQGIRGVLEPVGNLAQLQHLESVVVPAEQPRQQFAIDPVGLVLQPVDLDPVRFEILQRPQPGG